MASAIGARLHPVLLTGLLLAVGGGAGCAQFGVPEQPAALSHPETLRGEVFVVYDPYSVLGFGHTGLVLAAEAPGWYDRYDQYASAELVYARHLQAGTAHFLEGVSARLPSIFGFTREVVRRRAAPSLSGLIAPGERVIPIDGLDAPAVRSAARIRYQRADGLERPTAPRYFWLFNNCHHFVRDVLRHGGPIEEHSFPKTFVEAYLRRYEAKRGPEAGNALPPAGARRGVAEPCAPPCPAPGGGSGG